MRQSFRHVVVTRFNVPFSGKTHLDEAWLDRRFRLCDAICFPSLQSQTCSRFTWLIACDHRTPLKMYSEIAKYANGIDTIARFMSRFTSEEILSALHASWKKMPEWIITTRLDSDDALARNHIELLQAAAQYKHSEFLNFSHGWIWDRGRVCRREYLSNPFLSLVERAENYRGAYCVPHPKASSIAPVRQLDDHPGWLQVVHGSNLSTRVPPGDHEWFPVDILRDTFGSRLEGILDLVNNTGHSF